MSLRLAIKSDPVLAPLARKVLWPFRLVASVIFVLRRQLIGFKAPRDPALDEEAKTIFFDLLASARLYLEFGAGGTTIAAENAGVPTISVESDAIFAKAVRHALGPAARVRLLQIDLGPTKEWSLPIFVRPTERRLALWRRYVEAPFELLQDSNDVPDFVLVDGRFRRACLLKAAFEASRRCAKVRVLVDDYFLPGREHYRSVEDWVGVPRRVGRAALFDLSSPELVKITQSAIDKALTDYR
jgi:hypothetical protein